MTRGVWITVLLLVPGCSDWPGPGAGAPTPALPVEEVAVRPIEQAPAPRLAAEPLLTAEAAPDLKVTPVPAGPLPSPYSYPASYKPLHDGRFPEPTPIPVLPVRKPDHVLGDLRFLAPGSAAGSVARSPDGKRLAFGSCIFDAATGELDAAYYPASGVYKLAFSPNGERLYGSEGPLTNVPTHGTTLAVRDVPGKRQLLTIPVSDWWLSGDGRSLVTLESVHYVPDGGGPERGMKLYFYPAVRIYDTTTWKAAAAYRVRTARPTAVALSPDGGRILLGCDDGTVRVWDRAAGREVLTLRNLCEAPFPTHKPVAHLFAFSPDGKTLAAANARPHDSNTPRQVAWWAWPDGKLVHVKSLGKYHDPSDLRFSPDGKYVFCGLPNGAAVWDATTGETGAVLNRDRDRRVVPAVAFVTADRVFASGGRRPALLKFPSLDPVEWPDRPFDDRPKVPFELAGSVAPDDTREGRNAEIRLPDGSHLRRYDITRSHDWGVEHVGPDGKLIRVFEKGRVVAFDVSPDGKLLAAYGHDADGQGFDRPLRLWDVATGKEAAAIRVYPRPDYALRFSPDGKRLAVRHSDGLVRVWDGAARKPLLALDPGGYWPARLTFSKDGRFLVGGEAGSPVLIIWNVADDGR